ncbi:MAG TPA: carbon-nitrogen hydrolase family protein [Usitatibacter sp.]|nr:carbon-nitrogen hydrolase family protein [Usitatibacter sp.]
MDTVNRLRVAVVQSCATPDLQANLADLTKRIREAGQAGAQLIALPEACEFLHPENAEFRRHAGAAENPALATMAAAAREARAWLLVGSLSVRADAANLANRSYLLSAEGAVHATYDKIHLFDAAVEKKESLESRIYKRGDTAVVADIGLARIGLTVCYDLRFPHLYRALASHGAQVLAVPSAFMKVTGEAHWHTLLRARAIETGCFVIAPAQCGSPHEGRESYGHSLIVNPWGEVLADAGLEPGVIVADLDLAEVERARRRIASLSHNFDFKVVTV